jgi:hypothetical protein
MEEIKNAYEFFIRKLDSKTATSETLTRFSGCA